MGFPAWKSDGLFILRLRRICVKLILIYYDYFCLALLVTIEPFVIRIYDFEKIHTFMIYAFLWHFMSSMYLVPSWYRIFLLQKGPHCWLFYSNDFHLHILYIDLIQVLIFISQLLRVKNGSSNVLFSHWIDWWTNTYPTQYPISINLNYGIIWWRKKNISYVNFLILSFSCTYHLQHYQGC